METYGIALARSMALHAALKRCQTMTRPLIAALRCVPSSTAFQGMNCEA